MYKAVLFDMYRTLGEDVGHRHFIDELIEHGISLEDAHRIMLVADADAFDGAEHYEFSVDSEKYSQWREQHLFDVLRKHGIAQDTAETIVSQHKTWRAGFISKLKPYPETFEVLSALKSAGFQIGVCSNWDWDINVVVDDLGIGEVVDYVISSAQLGVRKPHPAFFERILESMHLTNEDAVFVGDTWATDIEGASGVGMSSIWVDRLDRALPDDRSDVTRVKDLTGVSKKNHRSLSLLTITTNFIASLCSTWQSFFSGVRILIPWMRLGGGLMFRFSRSRRSRKVSPVVVAVLILVSVSGVLLATTTTSNAAARGDCQYRGTIAVPKSSATGIAGGNTYTKAFCGLVAEGTGAGGMPLSGPINLVNPWVSGYKTVGGLKSPTGNWFVCAYPYKRHHFLF